MTFPANTTEPQLQTTVRRVVKNTFALAIADIVNKVLLFLFFIIAARHLGPIGFGIFSMAIAIINILIVFADMGISVLTTREVAREPKILRRVISNIIFIKLVISLIVIIIGWFSIKLLGYPPDKVKIVSLLFPCIIFFSFTQSFNSIFQALEKMEFIPLGKIVDTVSLLLGASLLVSLRAGPTGFALLYTISIFLLFIYSLGILWNKFTHFTIICELKFLKQILKQALPFGLGMIFATFYYWNGSALLSLWKGDEATGLYTAPIRVVLGTTFIPVAFVGAIYPLLSKTFIAAQENLGSIVERALRYMIVAAVPLCLFTIVLAPEIIQFFYGNNYLASVPLLRILIWWAGLIYLNAILAHFFYSINQQSVIAKQTFFAALLNVILNFLLIKKFGALGASFAIVSAELVSFVYLGHKILSLTSLYRISLYRLAQTLLKSVLGFLPSLFLLLLLKDLNLVILALLSLVLYLLLFFSLKGFFPSDLVLFRNLWGELRFFSYGRS